VSEPEETKVVRQSAFIMVSEDALADYADLSVAVREVLERTLDPNAPPPPPPWEGDPITPKPAGYTRLLTATDGLLRLVVELHGPVPAYVHHDGTVHRWVCEGCELAGYDAEPSDWPCETSGLIATETGVDLREGK
jgi:hypothetical protein